MMGGARRGSFAAAAGARPVRLAVATASALAAVFSLAGSLPSQQEFGNPSPANRPETWFHLIGGNVSKEGVDADLDAIAAAGLGGIELFHGDVGTGVWPGVVKEIPCLSAEWEELVSYIARGCRKRSLGFRMQNCPGWSMSGGPWIRSENAMRNLTYSRCDVEGGKAFCAPLPLPSWQMESKLQEEDLDYRDLFVLAFPAPEGDWEIDRLEPVSVVEKDENSLYSGIWRFARPVVVRSLELPSPRLQNHDWAYRPESTVRLWKGEGEARSLVLERPMPKGCWQDFVPVTLACGDEMSDVWTVEIEHRHPFDRKVSVRLSSAPRMDNWQGQAGWVLRGLLDGPAPRQCGGEWVKKDSIVDLTGLFAQGVLKWTPPPGKWIVLRIGHVNNGAKNKPAPKEATGWECNKLDRSGIEGHFSAYVGRLGKEVLGGDLKGFVVDSWECRRQTWTRKLEEEFSSRRNYRLRSFLPAVFGWIVDSPEATERFLLDWRRTLGELVEENYYAHMAELAREHGLETRYEAAFGDVLPGDPLAFWKHATTPMCEFWSPRAAQGMGQDDFKPIRPCASAAHIYGKKRVSAEAFTNTKLQWNEDLKSLKAVGNHAFARGVTHFVLHTYTHNPCTGFLPPGTSFGHAIGAPFIRGQTWWKFMDEFTAWAARCTRMLESGLPDNDILWFLGEDLDHLPSERPPFPRGYKADYVNADALNSRISVRDGLFCTPEGVTWKVLWVPRTRHLSSRIRNRLSELAEAGGRVEYSSADAAVEGLPEDVEVLSANTGLSLRDWREGEDVLEWLRRRSPDGRSRWYFVSPNTMDAFEGEVRFNARGVVKLRDPSSGQESPAQVVRREKDSTVVYLSLARAQSMFVVFEPDAGGGIEWVGRKCRKVPLEGEWRVTFPSGWGAPSQIALGKLVSWTELPLGREARHFSGTAAYSTKFCIPRGAVRLEIDLGEVESAAEIFVNGRKAGAVWAPPYRCDITDLVDAGDNELRIEVTSSWYNRLVYDAALEEKDRKTWTIARPKADSKPLRSGLLGPVVLLVQGESASNAD